MFSERSMFPRPRDINFLIQKLQHDVRRHNDPEESETSGRKLIVSSKDVREMKKMSEEDFKARASTWQ